MLSCPTATITPPVTSASHRPMTPPAFLPPTAITAHPLRANTHQLHRTPLRRRIHTIPKASLPPLPSLSELINRAKQDTKTLLATTTKATAALALVAALALPLSADAAGGGGRMGGSSFRAPRPPQARQYSAPRSFGPSYGPTYYAPPLSPFSMPGIYMSPFLMPGGFGLGGFGTVFILAAAAAFLFESVKSRVAEKEVEDAVDPVTTVAVVKVALLANARELQVALDTLARSADTATISGLRYILSETATSLLRNPDYWTHAAISIRSSRLSSAESMFEDVALQERLKLDEETLSNTRGIRRESPKARLGRDITNVPGEFIVVSLITAASGNLITKLPKQVDSVSDVRRALTALASVTRDDLQAVEVVWAPQSLRDVLTERELLQDHPELRRV